MPFISKDVNSAPKRMTAKFELLLNLASTSCKCQIGSIMSFAKICLYIYRRLGNILIILKNYS